MSGTVLLGSGAPFDLRSVQFSRKGSFLSILEDDEDRNLYLSLARSPKMWMQRKNTLRLEIVQEEKPLPIRYTVELGRLIVSAGDKCLECCMDPAGDLRMRVSGGKVRLICVLEKGETASCLNSKCVEVAFSVIGRLRILEDSGIMLFSDSCTDHSFVITLMPDEGTNTAEITVMQDMVDFTGHVRLPMSFDACVKSAEENFSTFVQRYFHDPSQASVFDLTAAWTVWSHTLGPAGNIRHEVVYMTRTQWLRAFGWQQSFHSMSVSASMEASWDLISTMFDYANPSGQLPDSIGDIGSAYLVSKPALQGLALDVWLKRYSLSQVPAEKKAFLYHGFSHFASWWLTCRDRNHTGLPQYFHADESPGEFCTCFRKGVPLYSPDLTAFVILLTEGCAKLAESLGFAEEKKHWTGHSEKLLCRLIDTYRINGRFVYQLVSTGEQVESNAFMCLLPVVLGRRLPKDIMDRLATQLTDEQSYLMPGGIAIENIQDISSLENHPGPKGAPAYVGTLMCIGLMDAGYVDQAREIAGRICRGMRETGFTFMHTAHTEASSRPVEKWTSWSAACYLLLNEILKGDFPAGERDMTVSRSQGQKG